MSKERWALSAEARSSRATLARAVPVTPEPHPSLGGRPPFLPGRVDAIARELGRSRLWRPPCVSQLGVRVLPSLGRAALSVVRTLSHADSGSQTYKSLN